MAEYMGKNAVVIGASMAGLATARVLLDHFEQVTIVERDRLPSAPELRGGVPQARHVHMLLKKGEQILEEFFPGLVGELIEAGATRVNWGSELRWYHIGGFRVQCDSDFHTVMMSRWMFEWHVRRRLSAMPRLRIIDGATVSGFLTDEARTRVTGVKLRLGGDSSGSAGAQELEERVDLVADVSGRDSKTPAWLPDLGFPAPAESRVNASVGYASRLFRPPPGFQARWKMVAIFPTSLENRRLGLVVPIESGEWLCSLCGANGDYPPGDDAGFLEFARNLAQPDVYDAIKQAEATSPIHSWRRTDNVRRHYEGLPMSPEGLVVLGDAFCAFNPLFGQGVTIAAIAAKTLQSALREERKAGSRGARAGFPRRFHAKLSDAITLPWFLATSEDLRYPETEGPKLPFGVKWVQSYMDRVTASAAESPDAYRALMEVINMTRMPTALFHPRITWRAFFGGGRNVKAGVPAAPHGADAR